MRLALAILLLTTTACATPCWIQFPLDGKAQSWCERSERAAKGCKAHGGILEAKAENLGGVRYGQTLCQDGTAVCVDNCTTEAR